MALRLRGSASNSTSLTANKIDAWLSDHPAIEREGERHVLEEREGAG